MVFKFPAIPSLNQSLRGIPRIYRRSSGLKSRCSKDEIGKGPYGAIFLAIDGKGPSAKKVVVKRMIGLVECDNHICYQRGPQAVCDSGFILLAETAGSAYIVLV